MKQAKTIQKIITYVCLVTLVSCTSKNFQNNYSPNKHLFYVYFEIHIYNSRYNDIKFKKLKHLMYEQKKLGHMTETYFQNRISYEKGFIYFVSDVLKLDLKLKKIRYQGGTLVLENVDQFKNIAGDEYFNFFGAHIIQFEDRSEYINSTAPNIGSFTYTLTPKFSISETEILEQIKKNVSDSDLTKQIQERINWLRTTNPTLKLKTINEEPIGKLLE